MAVRLVVAVTDGDWFNHLSASAGLEEVNFWAPSAGCGASGMLGLPTRLAGQPS